MLDTNPQKQFEELKTRLLKQIQDTFPIKDPKGQYEVRVSDLRVIDDKGVDDIRAQFNAKVKGGTWAAPVKGTIQVVDGKGRVLVEKKNTPLAQIPKMTRHYGYIVDGSEVTIANQWRLKPGAYVKTTEKEGEYEAQFQLAKGKMFDLRLDPASGAMHMAMGSRKIPLYSVLRASGVTDDQLMKAWGKETFEANTKRVDLEKNLTSLATVAKLPKPKGGFSSPEEIIKAYFGSTKVDPGVMKDTLGVSTEQVNQSALFNASKKLLDVSAGKTDPDPIDSLKYKELWSPTDHFTERLAAGSDEVVRRVTNSFRKPSVQEKLRKGDTSVVKDVVPPDVIRKPLFHVFATSLRGEANQTNPLRMLSDKSLVTIKGPGGIQNDHSITYSNTSIDPSQLGYVDPVFTPEGKDTGATLHLATGVEVKNKKPYTSLYNLRTGKIEQVAPDKAATSRVVFPDQIKWSKGKPTPLHAEVRLSDSRGKIVEAPYKDADYVMVSPSQVFAVESNMVPFIQNDSAHRSTMSARHMGQAISVVGREAPLVQTEAAPGRTFEKEIADRFLAHKSPVDGTVKAINSDHIVVEDSAGKKHEVDIYDHYPLNDKKGMLHSTSIVKVGDKVTKNQTLAENNYTKGGEMALGANLRIAYLSNGHNHEDGIVLSQSAANALASEHLHKPSLSLSSKHILDKNKFQSYKTDAYTKEQFAKIDDSGLIKPGTIVEPGDPLILALGPDHAPDSIEAVIKRRVGRLDKLPYTNAAKTWDSEHRGEVVRVIKAGKNVTVHVKTIEPVVQGSKVSTRHSAKGIVSKIIPDEEMPVDSSGRPVQMMISPVGVPGRMNPGQILETAAGKIAEKTGKPYVVKNFDAGVDYLAKVRSDLKKHGIKETETLFDPKTGRKLGEVMVGPHYAFQLEHQIDKKSHVRHGGRYVKGLMPKITYDQNQVPAGGGKSGGQSLSNLGIYAGLVAGLKGNIEEMQTLKSDLPQAEATWDALVEGGMLPTPDVPFVYKKFESYMRGVGLNVEKEGSKLRLLPQTDAEVLALSKGEVKKPDLAVGPGKDGKPDKGGLFDAQVFGGFGGRHWGHIKLPRAMPNPVFAAPVASLLGVKEAKLNDIVAGKHSLPKYGTGPQAIEKALRNVSVTQEMKRLEAVLADPRTKGAQLSRTNKLYKSLRVLKEKGIRPSDGYMIRNLPVLPPIYRPYAASPDKADRIDPLNNLYRRVGQVSRSLNENLKAGVPIEVDYDSYGSLYQEVQQLMGTTPKGKKALDVDYRGRDKARTQLPGILHTIAGESPKDGFFQKRLMNKKQDYTTRATIIADPGLSPDEVGVPKKLALELFRPQVVNHLTSTSVFRGDLARREANEAIQNRSPVALRALEHVVENNPVLLKRDPVLHAYGLIGQKVKLTDSPAIKVSPLILPPIGGDIDGDQVSLFVPLSQGAKDEVHKLLPSQRRLSDATGDVLYQPANEAVLSLYTTSIPRKQLNKNYASLDKAEADFQANKINLNDGIFIKGKNTTLGRARLAEVVPEKFKSEVFDATSKDPITKGKVAEILRWSARNDPKGFGELTHNMSNLGFKMAYESGHSVTLKDLEPLRGVRDRIVNKAKAEVAKLPETERAQKGNQILLNATEQMHKEYEAYYKKHPTNISDMRFSKIKAKKPQFQGLVMAPMVVQDHLGRPQNVPVTKSFAEGIGVSDYWMQAQGARRGAIQKTQEVSEPGYFTKLLTQVNVDQPVTSEDCGTMNGVMMSIANSDAIDRYLASSVTLKGGKTYPRNSAVTPDMIAALASAKVKTISVRSPIKCRMPSGVCSMCMGVHPDGSNYQKGEHVGLAAAQAMGERAAQIMLRQTHGGGIITSDKQVVDDFGTVQNLMFMAKPNASYASVAELDGDVVTRVQPLKQGGWAIYTRMRPKKPYYSRQKPLPTILPGKQLRKGEKLTEGDPNVHTLLKTQGVGSVQNHMVQRLGDIYSGEGVKRRHIELAVRNATNLFEVTDPGDHPTILRGDYLQKTVVDEINANVLRGRRPIRGKVTLRSIAEIPKFRQRDWMGALATKDIGNKLMAAAVTGQRSNLTGLHPVPGVSVGTTNKAMQNAIGTPIARSFTPPKPRGGRR